jgi:V/A-type H+-transporting ATPase subunit E
MSVEKIAEKILRDAREEAERLLEEARREAARIRAQGEEDANWVRASILAQAEAEVGRLRREKQAEARLEAKRHVLAAKRAAIDRVFQEALRRLQELPKQEYLKLLKHLILEAAETGDEEIISSPADLERLAPGFLQETNEALRERGKAGALRLADETRELGGGVVLRGRRYEIDANLLTLIQSAREELETAVAEILFGTGTGDASP